MNCSCNYYRHHENTKVIIIAKHKDDSPGLLKFVISIFYYNFAFSKDKVILFR